MENHEIASQDQEFLGHLIRFVDCSKINKILKQNFIAKPVKLNISTVLAEIYNPKPTTTDYMVTVNYNVNYDQSLATMIKAGKYNWFNSDITKKHFPIEDIGEKEVETNLFHFNRVISTKDAIAEMDKAGFRPAKPAELLKFGELYPDLQKQFPIFALGQFWTYSHDRRRVLFLYCYGFKRRLDLAWYDDGWDGSCRFLGVRK